MHYLYLGQWIFQLLHWSRIFFENTFDDDNHAYHHWEYAWKNSQEYTIPLRRGDSIKHAMKSYINISNIMKFQPSNMAE